MSWFLHFIGADNLSGTAYGFWSGFGSDIGEIAIVGGLIDITRRTVRHHRERLSQAERHHAERQSLASAHHNEVKHLAERHHQRLLDQVAASAPPAAPPRASRAPKVL